MIILHFENSDVLMIYEYDKDGRLTFCMGERDGRFTQPRFSCAESLNCLRAQRSELSNIIYDDGTP